MPCEGCNVQFGIITRKKSCYECRRLFCKNCLEKRQEKILCHNCLIFTKRPLSKVDLGQLKNKDLILYLQSKHISTAGCVEKDDLINLVIGHVNSTGSSPRSPAGSTGSGGGHGRTFHFSSASSTGGSSGNGRGGSQSGSSSRNFYATSAENCANTFDQIKNTCQNLFTSFTDKLNSGKCDIGWICFTSTITLGSSKAQWINSIYTHQNNQVAIFYNGWAIELIAHKWFILKSIQEPFQLRDQIYFASVRYQNKIVIYKLTF